VVLLVASFFEVARVAQFGKRDGLAVPLRPAAGLVAGDEQDAVAPGSNANRIRTVPGRSSLRLAMDDPWMVSTSGRPRPGPTSARVSMACTTRVWVASSRESIQSRTSLTT
jgi:hypothetical protein